MGFEYERKFLVVGDGWLQRVGSTVDIRQGYIAVASDTEVRVRVHGDVAELTTKSREVAVRRAEINAPIPVDAARELLDTFATRIIEKTRYSLDADPYAWTVDVFHGQDEGLVLLEVESDDALAGLDVPEWVGDEVTADPRFRNSYLSEHPYSDWSDEDEDSDVS